MYDVKYTLNEIIKEKFNGIDIIDASIFGRSLINEKK
jgi:hypothetical protein